MSEIDVILIQLHRLFARVNPLIEQIDDLDEMERVRKNASGVAVLTLQLFIEKDLKAKKLRQQHTEDNVYARVIREEIDELVGRSLSRRFLKSREKLEEFLSLLDIRIKEMTN